MLDNLKKMYDKQVASGRLQFTYTIYMRPSVADAKDMSEPYFTDVSVKAIPPAPATSSSGWTPLLRAHLERVQPTVDRWRGTLDTLLVFVSL